MNTREVQSIFELLELINKVTPYCDLWFRGSSRLDFGLVPGLIWRNDLNFESNYISKFLVGYQSYLGKALENPWEQYALMQHHGLPTRLLDWSSSPLSALYFALHQDSRWQGDRVVWVLNPASFNEYFHGFDSIVCPAAMASTAIMKGDSAVEGEFWDLNSYLPKLLDKDDHYELPVSPIAMESPFSNRRLASQHGRFTLHGSNSDSLDIQLRECDNKRVLAAFVLKTEGKLKEFKDQLYGLKINGETIYQDLDSMVKEIVRQETRHIL
ncbi:FRG domain-containing protein [Pseudohongiella sp.]|uniref:FRG domain-containing protein n=1 Tax=marine sediment metagenome TaxID=412755 RepID=A0A0F9Z4M1_9ZZZZ|nr:FRG domain-containing protein [Pseudohongiella sp.]HDZ09314.1 FRG domain-containing protein [Pseudohongiella sp.]HEA63837.1 FRG domain-containing protein [Pseudohongiella sp.]